MARSPAVGMRLFLRQKTYCYDLFTRIHKF